VKNVGKQKGEGSKPRSRARNVRAEVHSASSKRAAEATGSKDERMLRLIAFAGYLSAVYLTMQSVNSTTIQPTFGFRWSSAVLGVVMAISVALIRNELGVADRLNALDAGRSRRIAYSSVWVVLGVIAAAAVTTLPRY